MKITIELGLTWAVFAAVSYAETWTGKLLDAACHERSQQNPAKNSTKTGNPPTCEASTSTGEFALQTSDGKVYRLDAVGNSKASTAIRGNPDNKSPAAEISGAMEGQILK